jgi:hypothetical protein
MSFPEKVAGGCIIFVAGAIGGSVFYLGKGTMRNSSRGCRLAGGVQAVIVNGPGVRRAAAWFAVLTVMESTLHECNIRGPLNRALAWGAANVVFSMRQGRLAAVRSGLKGAAYGGAMGIAFYSLNASLDYLLDL